MRKWWTIWIESFLVLNVTVVAAATDNGPQMYASMPSSEELAQCETRLDNTHFEFSPVYRQELYGARGGPALMSSKGEIFLGLTSAAKTGIYNFTKDRFTAFDDGLFADTSDVYESRSGRIYFGYLTDSRIRIFDAKSAKNILDLELSQIPNVGDLLSQLGPASAVYRVLFFETNAGVQFAIVPRNDDLYLDEAFVVPIATVNLKTGEKSSSLFHSGMIRYERMRDGHAYGIGWEREMGGRANTLLVTDLSLHKNLLREKFEHAQNPPIIALPLSLFFESPRKPELVMVLPSPTGKVLRYQREARQFMPIPGLSRSSTAGIQFFNDHEGKPWFAAVEGNENNSLTPDYFRLVVQPMAGLSGSFVRDLEVEHPLNEISALEVIERPEGRLFLAWERTVQEGKLRYARVHIIDQNTRTHTTAAIPADWPGTQRRKTFWDPVRRVLYTYFVRDEGTTPEFAEIFRAVRVPLVPVNEGSL